MKSFRWNAIVGLVSGAIVGSSLLGAMKALALPQDQILKKLQSVPVFTIVTPQGIPLAVSPDTTTPNPDKRPFSGVFVNKKDAEDFLDKVKITHPDVAKGVSVVPVPLSEVYKLNQISQNQPDAVSFVYVPHQYQVDAALKLLNPNGQRIRNVYGVPLFMAKIKDKGYLAIQQGNEKVIPIFFQHEGLEAILARLEQQQPTLAASIEIEVTNLEEALKIMRKYDTPEVQRFMLIPPKESVEYIRSLQPVRNSSTPASSSGQ